MKKFIPAAFVVFAGFGAAAHADVIDYPVEPQAASTMTRTQVQAELAEARAAGLVTYGESDYPPVAQAESDKSRAQVRQELNDYRVAEKHVVHGEEDFEV